jgi:hypothetical protein
VSKRTQFRNQHRFRQPPKAVADAMLAAQTQVDAETDKDKRKFLWANAFYGISEWWKYRRLRAKIKANRPPHQGKRETARRIRQRSIA